MALAALVSLGLDKLSLMGHYARMFAIHRDVGIG